MKSIGNAFYGKNGHRQYFGNVFKNSIHAEIDTLYKILKKNKIFNLKKNTNIGLKSTMYVVRLMNIKNNKHNNFYYQYGNSKPCKVCQYFLYIHGFKKIKYTNIIDGENYLCEMKIKKNIIVDHKALLPHINNVK